jgi:hypothetical protein
LAPQAVRSSDGWTVKIGGRYRIDYVEDDRLATVKADVDSLTLR